MVETLLDLERWIKDMCSKCGSYRTNVIYHKDSYGWSHVCGTYDFNKKAGEHLHVTCGNCHYDWTQPVLNA